MRKLSAESPVRVTAIYQNKNDPKPTPPHLFLSHRRSVFAATTLRSEQKERSIRRRGTNPQAIFCNDREHRRYLEKISCYCDEKDVRLMAYLPVDQSGPSHRRNPTRPIAHPRRWELNHYNVGLAIRSSGGRSHLRCLPGAGDAARIGSVRHAARYRIDDVVFHDQVDVRSSGGESVV